MAELSKRERDKLARMAPALDRVERLLFELVQQGLQRLSRPVVDQLGAAQNVAHHAGLVAIERELAALGTQAERYLDRDPQFHPLAWLGALHRTRDRVLEARVAWAPDADLTVLTRVIGTARRQYMPVGEALELQAVAARGWVTDSDYMGLTVYLRELGGPRLFQASLARPTMYFGTDPRRLLFQDVSDHHHQTMLDLAHGAWTFHGARVSHDDRLSLHRDLHLAPGTWQGAQAYGTARVDDWLQLVERLTEASARGESSALVYLEPTLVTRPVVDEKANRVRAGFQDRNGAWLQGRMDLLEHHNFAIDNLQRLTQDRLLRPDGWFGRAWIGGGELCFEPWTALYKRPITLQLRGRREVHALHLSLESADRVTRS